MSLFLVSGGAGFIGSHLTEGLVNRGKKVRVIDNFATGKREENIEHFLDKIELIEGDIRKPEDCKKAMQDVSVVFHEAAIPSVPKSVEDPALSHAANVDGTFNMLLAARDAGIKRFVYAASSSAYGDTEVSPKHEKSSRTKSPYAVAKLVGEYYLRSFYECFKLQTISIRYFNVFGPRQDPKSQYAAAIPAFVTSILQNKQPTVYGDGEQSRDFTYIENVVEANLLAAAAPETHGEVINVACGESVTVNAIIKRINELLGKDVKPIYVPSRPGDVKHSLADIKLAGEIIGYRPKIYFDKGLQLAIDWYVNNAAFWKK